MNRSIVLLCCFLFGINIFGQISPILNPDGTSGTIDGVPFTISGLDHIGQPPLTTADLSTIGFAAAPLSASETVLQYNDLSDWTITFDYPVNDLRIYVVAWRSTTDGDFSAIGNILSSSNLSLVGTTIDSAPVGSFSYGIIEFPGSTSSLSFNSTSMEIDAGVAMFFTVDSVDAPEPIPTLGQWSLTALFLLLSIVGITAIRQSLIVRI